LDKTVVPLGEDIECWAWCDYTLTLPDGEEEELDAGGDGDVYVKEIYIWDWDGGNPTSVEGDHHYTVSYYSAGAKTIQVTCTLQLRRVGSDESLASAGPSSRSADIRIVLVQIGEPMVGSSVGAPARMKTSWLDAWGFDQAQMDVTTVPSGFENAAILEIDTVEPPDHPPGTGALSKPLADFPVWVYRSMFELTTELHPVEKSVRFTALLNGRKCPGVTATLTVQPVYCYLIGYGEYARSMAYVDWKYAVVDPSNIDLHYKSSIGDQAYTTLFNNTYIGPDRLEHSENWTAYTIGHENVHGGQSYYLRWLAGGGAATESLRLYLLGSRDGDTCLSVGKG